MSAFRQLDAALADGPAARQASARCPGCSYASALEDLDGQGFCADCRPLDTDDELRAHETFDAWLDSRRDECIAAFEHATLDEESTDL